MAWALHYRKKTWWFQLCCHHFEMTSKFSLTKPTSLLTHEIPKIVTSRSLAIIYEWISRQSYWFINIIRIRFHATSSRGSEDVTEYLKLWSYWALPPQSRLGLLKKNILNYRIEVVSYRAIFIWSNLPSEFNYTKPLNGLMQNRKTRNTSL